MRQSVMAKAVIDDEGIRRKDGEYFEDWRAVYHDGHLPRPSLSKTVVDD